MTNLAHNLLTTAAKHPDRPAVKLDDQILSYAELLDKSPDEMIRRSVRGMLPKNTLGRAMLGKLNVYAGPDHPHAAQRPEALDLPAARRAS